MELLGHVVEVLSEKHLLLKLSKKVEAETILTIYAKIAVPELQAKYSLHGLHLPKGEVRVVLEQGNQYYLAETFREKIPRTIQMAGGLLAGLMTQEADGPLSAKLPAPTLPTNLRVDMHVAIGDPVGTS